MAKLKDLNMYQAYEKNVNHRQQAWRQPGNKKKVEMIKRES